MPAKRPAYQFRLDEILLFINTLKYKVNVKYEICAVRLLSVQCDYRLQCSPVYSRCVAFGQSVRGSA